jgi:hypothetical protein
MKYLYYRLWQLFAKIKTNDMPATNAMIFLTLWQFLNLSLIYILLKYYSLISIGLKSKVEIYITVGIVYSILTFIDYFLLYKNRDKIYEKYRNETNKQKYLGNILLALYVLGSFVLVFYFGPKYTANIVN